MKLQKEFGMKGSTQGLRFESVSVHGGFHGVVSHGIPAFVKAPDLSSQETSRG